MLGAGRAISAGVGAASRQPSFIVPLAIAELAAVLVAFVPNLFVDANALAFARHASTTDRNLAPLFGALASLVHPSTWMIFGLGLLLVTTGGALLRAFSFAGALPALSQQLDEHHPIDATPFDEAVMTTPERWLGTWALARILWLVALGCAGGTVVLGIAIFTARPGVVAAFLMTVATAAVVCLPYLDAALDVAFVRSVVLCEGPLAAIAGGLKLAWKRSDALLPAWAAYVLADFAIAIALVGAEGTIAVAPQGHGRWVLLLVPHVIALAFAAFAHAAVSAARLGTFAALAREDAGTLPAAPEPVFAAVAVTRAEPPSPA